MLDCNREKVKNAMSALLVEILLPVAAVINLETSLPVVKKFVSMLYNFCVDHARKKHSTVSQRELDGLRGHVIISFRNFFQGGHIGTGWNERMVDDA